MIALDVDVQTPLSESLPRLRRLVSPHTGIVRLAFGVLASPGDPRMHNVTCISSNSVPTIGAGGNDYSGGISASPEIALAAAIGEAAERYSASYVPFGKLRLAKARDLTVPHLDPSAIGFFSPEQYATLDAFVPFDRDTPVQWVPAVDVATGTQTLLPSALCYLPEHLVPGESRITYSTSSGVACAATSAEALLSGLYELVERDAFVLMWYSSLSLPLLEWSGAAELEADEERYYAPTGARYRAVDLSGFLGVPTVMVTVRDPSGFIDLAIGCASARTLRQAWGKAMREAFQTHAWARQIRLERPDWSFSADFSDIKTFEDHVAAHAIGTLAPQTAFLDASPLRRHVDDMPPVAGPSVRAQITALVERLRSRGFDVYALDVTSPDVADAGLRVVRAFSPQLARIDADYAYRFLGVPRLYDGAYQAGLLPQPLAPGALNPLPHPFP